MTPAPRTDSRRGDHEPSHTNANHEEIADETGPATPRHPGSSAPRAKRPVDLLARRPLYWIAALASVAIVLLIGVEITQDRTRVLRSEERRVGEACRTL